jgi:hypothetical protein
VTKTPEPFDYRKAEAELRRAFQRLPIKDFSANKDAIPYDFWLRDIPRQLLLMRPLAKKKTLQNKKGLHDVARSAARTLKILDALSDEAKGALTLRPDALRRLRIGLVRLSSETIVPFRRGAPNKQRASKIRDVVAGHFFGLTGLTAPTKPFPTLLANVYKTLGIAASASSQAKARRSSKTT